MLLSANGNVADIYDASTILACRVNYSVRRITALNFPSRQLQENCIYYGATYPD
jgi:hypothetical protein